MSKTPPTFLMSPPSDDWRPRAKANRFSQNHTSEIPRGAAKREWERLKEAIESAGGVVEVCDGGVSPASPSLTGLPYTAEAGLFINDGSRRDFWSANVTPEHRKPEAKIFEAFCRKNTIHVHRIQHFWEGQGDCFLLPGTGTSPRWIHTYGVGRWARTEASAFEELRSALPGTHLSIGFHADPWFHGNTFLGFFSSADETHRQGWICPEALLDGSLQKLYQFASDIEWAVLTKEESMLYPTNALQVGASVIHLENTPDTILRRWEALGLRPIPLSMPSLFRAGGGGPVCLTNRWIRWNS